MADSPLVPGKLYDSASTNKLLLNFLDGYYRLNIKKKIIDCLSETINLGTYKVYL